MKTKLAFLLAFVALFCNSFYLIAQQEWAPIGAVWHYNIGIDFFEENVHPLSGFDRIEVTGDTLVNGMTMRKVGEELMYQDGHKVYYWKDDHLRLIYDFGVEVGDQLIFEFPACTQFDDDNEGVVSELYEIVEVELVEINGIALRKITAQATYTLTTDAPHEHVYMERIGSTRAIVRNACSTFIIEYEPAWLRCYEDEQIDHVTERFLSFEEEDCNVVLELPNNTTDLQEEIDFGLFPNPANDVVNIEYNLPERANYTIRVVNAHAQVLKQIRLPQQEGTHQIALSNMPNGLYLVLLESDGDIIKTTKLAVSFGF